MNYEKDKKQLIYIMLAVIIAFAIYKISGVTILPMIEDNVVRPFAGECVFASATVIAAILVKKIGTLKPTGERLMSSLLLGWPMFILMIMGLCKWLLQLLSGEQAITVSAGKIMLLVIAAILVGIAEELLIRGILINGLLDYYGNTTASSIRKAVIISSIVFGALHLFNVFSGVTFLSATVQALNAIFMGTFFGAQYIRSGKNLWPCIILHAVWDFNGFILGGMLMGKGTDEAINSTNVTALAVSVFYVAYALFLLRNKKMKELEEGEQG